MRKKKIGFTLIELLAVIVILGIIILIAVPIILDIIKEANINASVSSSKMFINTAVDEIIKDEEGEGISSYSYLDNSNMDIVKMTEMPDDICLYGIENRLLYGKIKYNDNYFLISNNKVKHLDQEVYDSIYETCNSNSIWTIEVVTTSDSEDFTFLLNNPDTLINWGDGTSDTYLDSGDIVASHTYADSGTYYINISGTTTKLSFCSFDLATSCDSGTTPEKLRDILTPVPSSMGLTSAHAMFAFTSIGGVTASNFFDDASTNITNMQKMFYEAEEFNTNIGSWDTSNVTMMHGMLRQARAFNQNINNWDVSNVTNMASLFSDADTFNYPLNNWDVSSVTTMDYMFNGADSFNQPLDMWNTANTISMSYTFSRTDNFNQDISNWDTTNVQNMSYLFRSAIQFDQDISTWNTSSVTNMNNMFDGAEVFNKDLSSWCVSNISSEPSNFSIGADNWILPQPVWGSCL